MQTTKKRAADHGSGAGVGRFLMGVVALVVLAFFNGCTPSGPRAVLDGTAALERGQVNRAVEELVTATRLMPTNALAFSYLGLAFHQAGHPVEAERAYQRALALDPDLTEVHYNLGCLWLSQSNRVEQAKSEFTAYTLRRPNSAEGWLRLGQAQLRARELSAADKSLSESVRIAPHDPEALTALGLVRCERRRVGEAGQLFARALKEQPDYAPALLNQAVIAQQDLNDRRLALQRYKEYLSVKPTPEHAQSVLVIVHQLEQELNPPPREPVAVAAAPAAPAPHTNAVKPLDLAHSAAPARPIQTNTHPPSSVKGEATQVPPTEPSRPALTSNAPAGAKLEMVRLAAEPVIRPAEDLPASAAASSTRAAPERTQESSGSHPSDQASSGTQKRSFFKRINPMNLFVHDGKPASAPEPGSKAVAEVAASHTAPDPVNPKEERRFPRYVYRSPDQPHAGDREAAERAFAQGVGAQQARRFPEAIQAYQRAAQLDPSFYDAQYNLGLAAAENGNPSLGLVAYETALAIEPDSLDARYNFGLLLKQSGYVLDAVAEFEKVLAHYPNDGRTHLALGNLYAQQLHEPAKARVHYQAVLALAPQSPQAGAIRYWLSDHPK